MLAHFTRIALLISLTSISFASADDLNNQSPNPNIAQSVLIDRQPLSVESYSTPYNENVPEFSEAAVGRFHRYFQESPEWIADEEQLVVKN